MSFSVDLLNSIRNEASQEYQNRVPVATQDNIDRVGNALQTYNLVYNEYFPALVHKIGLSQIESKLFKNKLARFKSGTIYTEQDVEEIFIEMAKAEGAFDGKGTNPLGRRNNPDVKVVYHRLNREDVYAITVGDMDIRRAFGSAATHDVFVTGLFNALYSGAEYDEYVMMKRLLGSYNGYCKVTGCTEPTDHETAKDFVKNVQKVATDLTFASKAYNKQGVTTWTEKAKQVLFVHKDVVAEIDVEVLARAINQNKTDVPVEIVTLDDFGELTDALAVLADEDIFKVWDTLMVTETQRNAHGLFTNVFLHVHQIQSLSPFKNAVLFTTATE